MTLNVSSLLRRWHTHFVLSHPPPLHCVARSWLQIVKSTVSDTGVETWCLSVKHSNSDSVTGSKLWCLSLSLLILKKIANYITVWKMMIITVKVWFWLMPFETLLYMLLAHCMPFTCYIAFLVRDRVQCVFLQCVICATQQFSVSLNQANGLQQISVTRRHPS